MCTLFGSSSSPLILASKQNLFFNFVDKNIQDKMKNIVVCKFKMKIAIQGDSLCCFHAYVYYNPNWFISTRPLHYFLVPFP
jgi:hypothetical protein